jgi:hypothetical protein
MINSWLIFTLQQLPANARLQEQHTTTGLELGRDGSNIANPSDATTSTWTPFKDKSKFSCMHLPWLSEQEDFWGEKYKTLAEGTVRSTISHVVQTFREKGRPNPTKYTDHELSILLSRQSRAFRNDDPKQAQQKTLPFLFLNELAKRQVIELDMSIAQLTIGTAFLACPSCEYSKVSQREMNHSKLLCLRNIRFFNGTLLSAPSDSLELANSVAVTFEMQKNDLKHNTVIHRRTDDATLCPVLQWAHLVNRIWTYPSTSPDTPVCAVWRHDRLESIASHC